MKVKGLWQSITGRRILRQGKVKQVKAITAELTAEAEASNSGLHLTQARLLQGRTHLAYGSWEAAQAILQDALGDAHSLSSRILLWQLHAALGRATKDPSAAQVHFRIAADFIQQTAESLSNTDLRTYFLKRPEVNTVLERAK